MTDPTHANRSLIRFLTAAIVALGLGIWAIAMTWNAQGPGGILLFVAGILLMVLCVFLVAFGIFRRVRPSSGARDA